MERGLGFLKRAVAESLGIRSIQSACRAANDTGFIPKDKWFDVPGRVGRSARKTYRTTIVSGEPKFV